MFSVGCLVPEFYMIDSSALVTIESDLPDRRLGQGWGDELKSGEIGCRL